MIALRLGDLAQVLGGQLFADADLVVDGPVVVDSRQVRAGSLFVALAGEHVDGHDYADAAMGLGAVAVLCSRRVAAPCLVVDDVVAALGALARLVLETLRASTDLQVVAITGSAGKTSAKDIVRHILAAHADTVAAAGSFNNEIGVPLTVLRAEESTRFLVLEMGARGRGHIATLCEIARPDVSVVLNVGSAHSGEFGGKEQTALAKGELVEALHSDGTAILNADDDLVMAMSSRTSARVLSFGRAGEVRLGSVELTAQGHVRFDLHLGVESFDVTLPQLGEHQAWNAAAAAAVGLALGLEPAAIAASLATAIPASPMRMQMQRRADGLTVINDAYNANPESTAAALRTLVEIAPPGRSVAVLGEMRELGEGSDAAHLAIGELAAQLGVARIISIGNEASSIADGAGERGESIADVATAARRLVAELTGADVVLVKASRGVKLERVADALLDAHGKDTNQACLPS